MITLAIECSTEFGSVAVVSSEKILSHSSWKRSRSHGEVVSQNIIWALNKAKTKLEDIDFISVNRGPGSFTGLRVGLSAAKTLSYSNEKPIWAPNSFRILVEALPPQKHPVLCLMNAYSQLAFLSEYAYTNESWKETISPQLVSVANLKPYLTSQKIVIGDLYSMLDDELKKNIEENIIFLSEEFDHPKASTLGKFSLRDFDPKQTNGWNDLDALYIRPSAAEEKLQKGLLKPVT